MEHLFYYKHLKYEKFFDENDNLILLKGYEQDKCILINEIKNNKFHGKMICYHLNGNLFFETTYNNGFIDGLYSEYDSNNICIYKCTYINGILNGKAYEYLPYDDYYIIKNYLNDKLNGEYIYYSLDNKRIDVKYYKDDQEIDHLEYFNIYDIFNKNIII